jgi:sulfonate transport system substrate-binding protein
MRRREFLLQLPLASALLGVSSRAWAQSAGGRKVFRIGYQKNGVLVVARRQATLERLLAPQGIEVKWSEFASGPPMLEAINSGSIDFGQVGDTPPIYAQAAGAAIAYVAGQPSTNGQGIVVKRNSALHTLQDLKGRRVGFTRGSSAHNVTLAALEKAGLGDDDITAVYLSPTDAAAAFAHDSIDAWAIWDPYFAVGERTDGRILVRAADIAKTYSFYIASRQFVADSAPLLHSVIDALGETATWAESHRDTVAQVLAEVTGVALDIQTIAANRSSFAIGKLTDEIIAAQQTVADRFLRRGLIPKAIVVRDAVWSGALA